MNELHVWPRMPRGRAIEYWRALAHTPAEQARLSARTAHRAAAPPPWGEVVTEDHIADMQVELRSVADESGWPSAASHETLATVDRAWGHVLFERMKITPADASSEGGWSFLALVVVPDLALWRFRHENRERFIGLADHVFARLWWREFVLGAELMDGAGNEPFTEDELIALFRRRDLVANPTVARVIARTILRTGGADATRLARLKGLVVDLLRLMPGLWLDALDEIELEQLMTELVADHQPMRR